MFRYSIKPGDTLYGIAQRFRISINDIISANPQIVNQKLIYIGTVINIPFSGYIVYTIQPGDTIYLISNKFETPLNSLLEANPGINPENLLIGFQMTIPVNPPRIFPEHSIVGSSDKMTKDQLEKLNKWRASIVQFAQKHPNEVYINGPTQHKTVSLTFDDGPDSTITPGVLNVLKQYNVKAGFFFIGYKMNLNPEVVIRAYNEGHNILNHSWNHPNFTNEDVTSTRNQIVQTEEKIKSIIGKRSALIRPPYGAIDEKVLPVITSTNNKAVIWSIDSMDWSQDVEKNTIVNNVLNNVRPGDIVLMHSYANLNVSLAALPEIIVGLRSKGYSIIDPAELLGVNPYKP